MAQMIQLQRKLAAAFLLCMASGCGTSNEHVAIVPMVRDLGIVRAQDTSEIVIEFTIKNHTSTPLALRAGVVPCVCTKLDLGDPVIPPWESRLIKLKLRRAGITGRKTITAQLLTDNPSYPVFEPRIIGDFEADAKASKVLIDVGEIIGGTSIEKAVSIPIMESDVTAVKIYDPRYGEVLTNVIKSKNSSLLRLSGIWPSELGPFRIEASLFLDGALGNRDAIIYGISKSILDAPPAVYPSPVEYGIRPRAKFCVNYNSQNPSSKYAPLERTQDVSWAFENHLFDDLYVSKTVNGWEFEVVGKADIPEGNYCDVLVVSWKSEVGNEALRIPLYGLILSQPE